MSILLQTSQNVSGNHNTISILLIIIIFVTFLLKIIQLKVGSSSAIGKYGEELTERILQSLNYHGLKGRTLRNVYIPKSDGETTEIDVLYITQKGIFVFESKNYSGWIFGRERDQYWTAVLRNKQRNKFYNPIKQNRAHLKWLRNYVGDDIPLYSIVVFSERCELKKLELTRPDVIVINRDRLFDTVRQIWDNSPDVLPESMLDEIYVKLEERTNIDPSVKAAHIENIKNKYKTNAYSGRQDEVFGNVANNDEVEAEVIDISSQQDANASDDRPNLSESEKGEPEENPVNEAERAHLICPWCGQKLVLRTARRGPTAGKQFYGCSGFPGCRYTRSLP